MSLWERFWAWWFKPRPPKPVPPPEPVARPAPAPQVVDLAREKKSAFWNGFWLALAIGAVAAFFAYQSGYDHAVRDMCAALQPFCNP